MNVLAVQNHCHKCDLGNKNDSVLTIIIAAWTIFDCNNNYYNYYNEIILYMCMWLQRTLQVLLRVHNS